MTVLNPNEFRGDVSLSDARKTLLPRLRVAESFAQRSLGLMGRKKMPVAYGAGLFFPRCRSLHGCFMRFELEVWFLDEAGQPLGPSKRLKPWRMVVGPKNARHCMEILPGLVPPEIEGKWVWQGKG